ncbi:hypothetical protein [Aquincola sp. J276]|uniref:hypothetical protein n=1 Tax=Aquincola sp. J276 TaxID=2898432 RepID=UPI002151AF9D|nr:hypothetical protein [Aquincola sp. J276]MCR5864088.1 hypothetical protein [Aquincola sp. J276]
MRMPPRPLPDKIAFNKPPDQHRGVAASCEHTGDRMGPDLSLLRRSGGCLALCATLAGLAALGCASPEPAPVHVIRHPGGVMRAGYIAVDGRAIVPLNRTYEQLSPAEKALIRAWYDDMPAADEPPFPRAGLYPVMEAVRKGQQRVLAEGDLFLVATVNGSGGVDEVKAYGKADPVLVDFVSRVVMHTPFKPALCAGIPCRMDFPLNFLLTVK